MFFWMPVPPAQTRRAAGNEVFLRFARCQNKRYPICVHLRPSAAQNNHCSCAPLPTARTGVDGRLPIRIEWQDGPRSRHVDGLSAAALEAASFVRVQSAGGRQPHTPKLKKDEPLRIRLVICRPDGRGAIRRSSSSMSTNWAVGITRAGPASADLRCALAHTDTASPFDDPFPIPPLHRAVVVLSEAIIWRSTPGTPDPRLLDVPS